LTEFVWNKEFLTPLWFHITFSALIFLLAGSGGGGGGSGIMPGGGGAGILSGGGGPGIIESHSGGKLFPAERIIKHSRTTEHHFGDHGPHGKS
jgi:hypothetical protein